MPDVKKLITGFLILAAGASSSALILSGTNMQNGGGVSANQITGDVAAQSPAPLNGSAFIDGISNAQTPTNPNQVISTTTAAQLEDPTNLTNNLTDAFLDNLAVANPDGGQADANGQVMVTPPDSQAVLGQLTQSPAMQNFRIPNWDVEAIEDAKHLIITKGISPEENAKYIAGLKDIFEQYFIQPNLQGILSGSNSDPAATTLAKTKIQSALQAAMALPTPAGAANFQKSLIKVFVYGKNSLSLLRSASDDSVKAALTLEMEESKYNIAIQELQTEMQGLAKFGISFGHDSQSFAFINSLLGINTTHALFGLGDIVFDPAVLFQLVLKYAKDIALQILKNEIIAKLQQKVLNWIQGNGAPRFIQNWMTAEVNAYSAKAVNVLNQQFSCVPPLMLPSLRILLTTPNVTGGNNACAAQFQSQLGNNLQNFYNHFENGGFNSYFSLFQPNGNAFGAIIDIQDMAVAAGSAQTKAAADKLNSAQGYKGSEVCTDKSDPNGTHGVCLDQNNRAYHENANGTCDPGLFHALESNGGLCANGEEPQVTTPGNAIGLSLNTALDSSSKLITAANDIIGLLAAFTQSLLNSLADLAISSAHNAINGIGKNDAGIAGVPFLPITIPAPIAEPLACLPQSVKAEIDSTTGVASLNFFAQGGATDQDGNPPTYNWSAPGSASASGGAITGSPFAVTYDTPGDYTITTTASASGTIATTATCDVTITAATIPAATICGQPATTSGTCAIAGQTCVEDTSVTPSTFSCQ